ncbi:hypothetical protein O0L34_g10289 [Tuta absoluta]|nr:hypothetical protein O0L34_g10289 [Tuta absoluta]
MGKRYYCDYCDKTMAATPSTVRTHMKGLVHQKLVLDHYQKFKDPETILAEESVKKPCSRFPSGLCQFGSMCRFSHYTREQIDHLREIVAAKSRLSADTTQPSFVDLYQKLQQQKTEQPDLNDYNTVLYDKNGITHVFPWVYNSEFDGYGQNLPPSIRKLSISDFEAVSIEMWG